jgi:hypothetical protein
MGSKQCIEFGSLGSIAGSQHDGFHGKGNKMKMIEQNLTPLRCTGWTSDSFVLSTGQCPLHTTTSGEINP